MTTPGYAEADVTILGNKLDANGKKIWDDDVKSYVKEIIYDDFGKNKALSKAFRNACKVQIPQNLILEMIKIAKETGRTTEVVSEKTAELNSECGCSMTDTIVTDTVNGKGLHQCDNCKKPISEIRFKAIEKLKEAPTSS